MSRKLACLVLLILLWTDHALGQSSVDPDNPRRLPDDFSLPMPGGGSMVFRIVEVVGPEFWGNTDRLVKIGQLTAPETDGSDVFESPVSVMATGSFLKLPGGQTWLYHLGKYEVSKAQFAAVLGNGDLNKGLSQLAESDSNGELTNASLSGDKDDAKLAAMAPDSRARELAKPITWIPWSAVQRFIDLYNRWCFADSVCLSKLPTLDTVPGFFRLPTEVEWEYAARGGLQAIREKPNKEVFASRTPYPPAKWEIYANARPNSQGLIHRIGSLEPNNLGLFDMLGNAQELVFGLFQPELGQGKPGALIARGGSYASESASLRTSMRAEVELYKWDGKKMEEQRSPTTGFRITIGSRVVPTPQFRKQVAEEFKSYKTAMQSSTPSGVSQTLSTNQAKEPLDAAISIIDNIGKVAPTTINQVEMAKSQLSEVRDKLERGLQDFCEWHADAALSAALEFGEAMVDETRNQRVIDKYKQLPSLSVQSQQTLNDIVRKQTKGVALQRARFNIYKAHLYELGRCGASTRKKVLEGLAQRMNTDPKVEALAMLTQHSGNGWDPERWQAELTQRMGREALWQ